jgi:hypothetical protein
MPYTKPLVTTVTSSPRATVKLLVAVTSGLVYGISSFLVAIFSIFIVAPALFPSMVLFRNL